MAKLSKTLLAAAVASYVQSNKIAVDSFNATYNNTVGLLDKIAKTYTIESTFVDKLAMFNGEELGLGKTIEEWKSDLIMPVDYDETGAGALAPHKSTYRPVSYSYTQGRKYIPQTIYNNDVERAVNNPAEFAAIIADKSKAMYDSETMWEYALKRQALGSLIARCVYAMNPANATVFAAGTAMSTINTLVKEASASTDTYILVKKYGANDASSFDDAVAKGFLIKNELAQEIAKPVDTATGEAFIEQVKKDVEIAGDFSEGHSLNGNTLGVVDGGLVLVALQGIKPVLDVQVLAGAFHEGRVALPAELVTITDFGNDASGAYAILMDRRGMRSHNSYRAVRENINGEGDFLNLFFHTEWTIHISRNTFVKVYKAS